MSRSPKFSAAFLIPAMSIAALLTAPMVSAQNDYKSIGRAATPQEVAAWNIDVRPDFKGLPQGAGSVSQGMEIWESQCASCHGVFGESNQTFSPLVGGTTAQDIKSGQVARLNDAAYPGRTTLMKVSNLSTLWDYINRAMPWNAPKSLSTNEVYAVTAYLLNLGGIVPDNLVLSNTNIAEVQKLLPNRNGMTTDHGLWPGKLMGHGAKPDVKAVACMKDCAVDQKSHPSCRILPATPTAIWLSKTAPWVRSAGWTLRKHPPQTQRRPARWQALHRLRPWSPPLLLTLRPWPCHKSTPAPPATAWTTKLSVRDSKK